MNDILNWLLYSSGWFWSVFFGAQQRPLLALLGSCVPCALQFGYLYFKEFPSFFRDLFLALCALAIGFLAEMALIHFHIVQYATEGWLSFFPPAWVLGLYPLFSLTLNYSLRFLNHHLLYPAALALFVPYMYFLAYKIGACSFPSGMQTAMLILIALWGLVLVGLTVLNRQIISRWK